MSDRRIDPWSRELAELQPRASDGERYRQLWLLAANALSAFAFDSGRVEGLMGAPWHPSPARSAAEEGTTTRLSLTDKSKSGVLSAASPPEGATGEHYAHVVPGSRVPFAAGEEFSLYPSTRPESKTLDITKDGRITIAADATPEELRAALWMVAHAFNRLRGKVADLECRPLVLLAKREAHAEALVVTGVCDQAEAERRAARYYPLSAERSVV